MVDAGWESSWSEPSGVRAFTDADLDAAAEHLFGLPSAEHARDTDEEAKRFDLLALRAQLGVVSLDPADADAFAPSWARAPGR